MLYFYFSFLFFLTNWLWRLSWPPQWDLTPTLRWQLGGAAEAALSSLSDFYFGPDVGKKTATLVWKTSRTEGPVTRLDPTRHYTHWPLPPVNQHTEGYSCYMNVWQIEKIKLWPKINQHLKMNEIKPKRHNRTICMIMCTCIERNVIIDLYGENIVHWIYRMIFVFRVWVTNSVRWLEANHWVCSSKITDSAFSFVL